jgi:hypothetical protein
MSQDPHFRRIMKNHVRFILLVAVVFCCLIPAGTLAAGVNDSGSGFIVVTNPPVADFYTSTQFGTAPLLVTFSDRSLGSPPFSYLWEFGDGSTSTEQNPTHSYTRDGLYTVSLTVTNQYGTDKKRLPGLSRSETCRPHPFSLSPSTA